MKTLCLLLFVASFMQAQDQFMRWITYLNITSSTAREASIDSFMSANSGQLPYIESDTAVFVYRSSATTMQLAGDFNVWSPSYNMIKVGASNFYYYAKGFESNARVDYKYVKNGSTWILDPHNPKTVTGGFGPNSELAMPEYIQPSEIIFNPAVAHGSILATSITAANGVGSFGVKVYLPPGYASDTTKHYPTAYFHDGYEYIDLASAVTVIDNLIAAGTITPIIAVFVRPNNRNDEYAGNKRAQYAEFFAGQLVQYIDLNYRTQAIPSKRMTAGDSFGGNISGYITFHYTGVFGLCGLHSGAFWPNNYEVYNNFINAPFKEVKFAAVWGTYESLFTNMRAFRDVMINKGNEMRWIELPEGHSWGLWRANIDFLLEYFFPLFPSSVKGGVIVPKTFAITAYPNPFNAAANIEIELKETGSLSVALYNIFGEKIKEIYSGNAQSGKNRYTIQTGDLPSGTYLLVTRSKEGTASLKIVLLK